MENITTYIIKWKDFENHEWLENAQFLSDQDAIAWFKDFVKNYGHHAKWLYLYRCKDLKPEALLYGWSMWSKRTDSFGFVDYTQPLEDTIEPFQLQTSEKAYVYIAIAETTVWYYTGKHSFNNTLLDAKFYQEQTREEIESTIDEIILSTRRENFPRSMVKRIPVNIQIDASVS